MPHPAHATDTEKLTNKSHMRGGTAEPSLKPAPLTKQIYGFPVAYRVGIVKLSSRLLLWKRTS